MTQKERRREKDRFYKYRARARLRGESEDRIILDFELNITPAIRVGQMQVRNTMKMDNIWK